MGTDNNPLYPLNAYDNILLTGNMSGDFECLAATFEPNSDVLVVGPSDCNEKRGVVCMAMSIWYVAYYDPQFCERQKEISNLNSLSLLFDSNWMAEKDVSLSKKKTAFSGMMARLDGTRAFESIFSTVWYATMPCFDVANITAERDGEKAVMKYCEWKGMPVSCAAIFSSYPTDQGMCCSFNMKAADDIYHAGPYSKTITKLQNADAAGAFADTNPPDWYSANAEPTSVPGRNKGLFLILDAHTDQFITTSQKNDFDGFVGMIHPRGSFPMTSFEGFEIKPGHLNSISVTGTMVEADDSMKDMDVNDRRCLFSHETSGLHILKEYSYSNCMFECSLFYALEKEQTE